MGGDHDVDDSSFFDRPLSRCRMVRPSSAIALAANLLTGMPMTPVLMFEGASGVKLPVYGLSTDDLPSLAKRQLIEVRHERKSKAASLPVDKELRNATAAASTCSHPDGQRQRTGR
jgi:hypothetical protein